MAYARLTTEPIDKSALAARVRDPGNGGYVAFEGDVRDLDGGRPVARLFYHAYEALAAKELARIAGEAEQRWLGASCAVEHRLGRLEIGETSIMIAVGAPHRAEAFEACRWIIDTVKTSVPIWKREEYAGNGGDGVAGAGEQVWIEGDNQMPAGAGAAAPAAER